MITKILGGATAISLGVAIACFNLWQGAKEDLAEEIGKCNTEHLTAALASANIALDAQKAAYEQQLAERDRTALITENGLEIASEALVEAESVAARHEITIEVLQLEVEADEIPDSRACLNVFVPRPAIEWLCVQAGHHPGAGAGAGADSDSACSATGGFNSPDPAFDDFAAITYGGAITRWGQDRRGVMEANGRFLAIEKIQEELADGGQ